VIYICDTCFKIYKLSTFIKKNNECEAVIDSELKCLKNNCNGTLFETDELFAPIVSILNKKGYKTKFCCSGHIKPDWDVMYCPSYTKTCKNYGIESYIVFENDVELPSLPDGYKYDEIVDGDLLPNCIRKTFDDKKKVDTLLMEIINNTVSVLDWAKKLKIMLDKDKK
jgi:hypothetical protein